MDVEAEAKGDYLNAVRNYRETHLHFELGELPVYIEKVDRKAREAYDKYEKLLSKLTKQELKKIKIENKQIGCESGNIDLNIKNFEKVFCNWSKNRFEEI